MNRERCSEAKDLLPAYLEEQLSDADSEWVGSHVERCEDCRAEVELIAQLRLTVPRPRADLSATISQRVRSPSAPGVSRRWWVAAAASVVFAVGTGVVWDRIPNDPMMAMVAEQVDNEFWPGDETLIAGGLVWDDLSEEEMTVLLEEWDDEA